MRNLIAFIAAAVSMYFLSAIFYTHQILVAQASMQIVYSKEQEIATYIQNLQGLALGFGLVIVVALGIAFIVAAQAKKILTPLAPIAYPIAGAVATVSVILLIENTAGSGGVGAIGGARSNLGLALQALAGGVGGIVFEVMRKKV